MMIQAKLEARGELLQLEEEEEEEGRKAGRGQRPQKLPPALEKCLM